MPTPGCARPCACHRAPPGWRPWRVPRACSARVPIWTGVPRWRQRANRRPCSPRRTKPYGRFPSPLPIRAAVADYLCTAATHLHDTAALRAGRWEAFVAKPTLARLLDVWEVTPAGTERTRRMSQAAQHVQHALAHPPAQVTHAWVGRHREHRCGLISPSWRMPTCLPATGTQRTTWPRLSRSWAGAAVTTRKGWSCRASSCRCPGHCLASSPQTSRNCGTGNSRTVRVLCPGIVQMQEKPACSYACSTPTRSACPKRP